MSLRRKLVLLVAAGVVARLVVALITDGHAYDMASFRILRDSLADHGIDVYEHVNLGNFHWPYASGFFPWVALAGALDGGSDQAFATLVRLPAIAADAALAWAVQHYLGLRGASERIRLAAAALVVLGPVFALVSGHHGQIDAVAILPAVLAYVVWERVEGERRALYAGLLIGLGAAIKTVPIFALIPLLPWVRSWRELVTLGAAAAAVPLAVLAPFLIASFDYVDAALRDYHGFPGIGGLSLAVQPELAESWLKGSEAAAPDYSGPTERLVDRTSVLGYAIIATVLAFVLRFRPRPAVGASLLWLAVLTLAPAFFFQYLIWGLPFFLMAGYLRAAAALQLAVAVPMALFYLAPWEADAPTYVYVAVMLATWLGMLAALFLLARRMAVEWRERPA
ncbi:MAG: DUF2029 domain-containing protein [Actinomycetota bacterium]|nr:DUF2029 domain-containing protein [Actinomycetota bacterium]